MKITDDQAKKTLDQRETLLFSCPAGDRYIGATYRVYHDARQGYLFDTLYQNETKWRNPRGSHSFGEFVALLPGPAQRTDEWKIQTQVDEEPSEAAGNEQ